MTVMNREVLACESQKQSQNDLPGVECYAQIQSKLLPMRENRIHHWWSFLGQLRMVALLDSNFQNRWSRGWWEINTKGIFRIDQELVKFDQFLCEVFLVKSEKEMRELESFSWNFLLDCWIVISPQFLLWINIIYGSLNPSLIPISEKWISVKWSLCVNLDFLPFEA